MKRNLGIWMDHRSANVMDLKNDTIKTTTIESNFTHKEKAISLAISESLMHNKEQQKLSKYYRELGDVISDYDEVILFGPTDAKMELFNLLKNDVRFEEIQIKIEQTDKMTANQQHSFVKKHFSK